MRMFSESVNEKLGKKLITEENETDFLFAFKRACENQIDLSDDMLECELQHQDTIEVWGERLTVNYEIEIDEDGILSTVEESIC